MQLTISPLYKIITLSSVLALGFILIILSCALFDNWLPLTVAPNAICGKWANSDDFMSETGSGIALPIVFAHNHMINIASMVMSLTGGSLVYLTIITFGMFFHEPEEF